MQITHLKFEGDWILHPEVSKFGFTPKVCEYLNFTPQNYETLGCKLQTPSNVRGWNPNFEISRCKIQSPPKFRGVICNLSWNFEFLFFNIYILYFNIILKTWGYVSNNNIWCTQNFVFILKKRQFNSEIFN